MPATQDAAAPAVGPLLRHWRERAGLSQLELALRADSSARHLSFVETGRSVPSREMVLRLAATLQVPVRERNTLLLAAGYAPVFPATALDDPALAEVRAGLERMVAAYEPYPALVMDGRYEVVTANRGIALLLDGVSPALRERTANTMRLTLHPEGMAPRIRNLPEWRAHLLAQMRRQLALDRSPAVRELYEEVTGYPAPDGSSWPAAEPHEPDSPEHRFALPLVLDVDGQRLSFLSTLATFNTPLDVTVSELAVETFLPADPATAKALREAG